VTAHAGSATYAVGSCAPRAVAWNEAERFAASLDAHAMGPRLSAALSTRHRPCHVLDARYEPGIQATVLYQLGDDLIRGDLLSPHGSRAGASMTGWPGMELSVYPDDPGIPTLPMAMTASVVGPQLAQLSAALTPVQRRALSRRCRVALLRYRPGKRATVRLGTPVADASYVAKVYHDPAKAAAVAHEARALARTAARDGLLRLAPTIGHLPEISAVVQQSIHGQPLDSLLRTASRPGAASAAAVRRAASALAQLHRGAMVSTRLRPVGKELHRFMARALRISAVDSSLGAQLTELAERLLQTFSAFPISPLGLVHGDCKPGQFLLTKDGGVYLLDFDHCGVSDQTGDAGTFVASLRQLAVRRIVSGASPASTASLDALADEFITSYNKAMDDDLSTRIRWHEVVALQRKALRSFARSPRSPLPAALVEAGHRCLDRVTQELS
jgi:aminoglycoside phosphotransferase (APT) family kinase protein